MSLTMLKAVALLNDVRMLAEVLPPLIEQGRAMGLGDHDEISAEALEQRAAATGHKIEEVEALIARMP